MEIFDQEEKRRSPRIRLGAPLRYQVRGAPEFRNALSENISRDGVSFTCANFLAPSTHLMLEMSILSRALTSAARVAWAKPIVHSDNYRLGVEFVELNPKERDYIGDYIDTRLNRF